MTEIRSIKGLALYIKCENCEQIEPLSDSPLNPLGAPGCKHCMLANRITPWPSVEICKTANLALEHSSSQEDLKLLAPIFCCVTMELILEDHLKALAWTGQGYDETGHIIEALFEAHQGRSGLLLLFKRLEGHSYKEMTAELGYGKCYDDWETIVGIRNKIVHGKGAEGELAIITKAKISAILAGMLEVSRQDQNDYTKRFSPMYKYRSGES